MGKLFHVGQVVICINDDFSWSRRQYPDPRLSYPKFAARYIIREYLIGGKCPAVALQEINNPDVRYFDGLIREAGFWERRFVAAPPPAKVQVEKKEEEYV